MSRTITVSNEVYAAIVARRLHSQESEEEILGRILVRAGNAEKVHDTPAHKESDDAHLILDSDMDHIVE